jgi:site-specific recombinase XerD
MSCTILDKYISKRQSQRERSLLCTTSGENLSKPWYNSVPVGKHSLHANVKNMCSEAGISGHKTNHSLHATAATEMFRRGAPEKRIQE